MKCGFSCFIILSSWGYITVIPTQLFTCAQGSEGHKHLNQLVNLARLYLVILVPLIGPQPSLIKMIFVCPIFSFWSLHFSILQGKSQSSLISWLIPNLSIAVISFQSLLKAHLYLGRLQTYIPALQSFVCEHIHVYTQLCSWHLRTSTLAM